MGRVAYLPQTGRFNTCTMIAAGPLFERAWTAYPDSGKRRSSRRMSIISWTRAALDVGEQNLLKAVLRYVEEDPDVGAPMGVLGFHKWLDQGRWEHWVR